jgi:predicted DNA-binding transcriptional regulator AlpA
MTTESVRRVTPSEKRAAAAANLPSLAMSIPEFCQRHNISLSFFYLLRERGEAPQTMRVGGRRLISIEEAARWRRERQTETA